MQYPVSEESLPELIYSLLKFICSTKNGSGAILVFLPGWAEISLLHKLLYRSEDFPSGKIDMGNLMMFCYIIFSIKIYILIIYLFQMTI